MKIIKHAQLTGHRAAIYDLMVHGDKLLSTGGDGWVVSWSLDGGSSDGQLLAQVDGKVFCMAAISDTLIVLGDMHGHVFWVDLNSNTTLRNVKAHSKGIYQMLCIGNHLYSVSADGYLTRWSTQSMLPEESLMITEKGLRCLLHIDSVLYIGTSSNEIVIVDPTTWSILHRWNAHNNSVFTLAQLGSTILSGGRDALLRSWSIKERSMLSSTEAHWYTINDLCIVNDLDLVVSASRDKSIRLWDATDLSPLVTMGLQQGGHVNSVNRVIYHNQRIYTAGDDRSIILWEIEDK